MTVMLFGDDLSKNVDDISQANKIATKLTGSDRGRSRRPTTARAPFLPKSSQSRPRRSYDRTRQQYRPIQYRNQSKTTAAYSLQKSMNNVSTYCVGNLATKVNEWSKITSDPWILQTIQAYRLEFKTTPMQFSPPKQHTRSKDECDLIQLEIAQETSNLCNRTFSG